LNCKGVIREISNYIDGELEPAVRAELERHLAHCEDCTMIVDQTKKTIQLYCDAEPVALPEEIHSRLHASFRKRMDPKQQ